MDEKVSAYLEGKDALIISCVVCRKEGVADYLAKYCRSVVSINVATRYSQGLNSTFKEFHQRELVVSHELTNIRFLIWLDKYVKMAGHLSYIFPVLWAILRRRRRFQICFAEGQIFTFLAVILKRLGMIEKVIYSSGDYFTQVKLYRFLDRYNCSRADVIWNATDFMTQKRSADLKTKIGPQMRLPLGLNLRSEIIGQNRFDFQTLIYMGNLQERQGFSLILEALTGLVGKFPHLCLEVIGGGPDELTFRNRVKEMGLFSRVNFYGFVSSSAQLDKILGRAILGLALYAPEKETATFFTDPGKIKDYLSYGLPIAVTRVPQIAAEIEQKEAGWVIDYTAQDLEKTLVGILTNPIELRRRAGNAQNLAKEYEWERVMDSVFLQTLKVWRI